jgi:glutamate formiminotransferase
MATERRMAGPIPLLECVANVSEGRDEVLLGRLADSCNDVLLDIHRDPFHHRAVFTLAGPAPAVETGAMSLARAAVDLLDLRNHQGVHPRFGVVDVVPFVRLPDDTKRSDGLDPTPAPPAPDHPAPDHPAPDSWTSENWATADDGPAIAARERFIDWAASELAVPCFRYGPVANDGIRSLPAIRRDGFVTLRPDAGPDRPHPSAGAMAVGARGPLVAYNLWLAGVAAARAREIAAAIRGPSVRALGLDLGHAVQVSCNLIEPFAVGPDQVFDEVVDQLAGRGVDRAELVGLIPAGVLARVPSYRWAALDIAPARTIEYRLVDPALRTR